IFYAQVALHYAPFVVLPALLGSWLVLGLVRVLSQPMAKRVLLIGGAAAVLLALFAIRPVTDVEATRSMDSISFEQLLRHTRLTLNPLLPSAWLAKSMLA